MKPEELETIVTASRELGLSYEETVKLMSEVMKDAKNLRPLLGKPGAGGRKGSRLIKLGGLFHQGYERGVLNCKDIVIDLHPDYAQFKRNPHKAIPVIVDQSYFQRLMLAHIEVLHILDNHIQKEYFGVLDGYSYSRERKAIGWERAIWGKAKVRILHQETRKS